VTCGRCGAPLARSDIRFCTRCGAPVGAAPPGQQQADQPGRGQTAPPYPQSPPSQPRSPYDPYSHGQQPYHQPQQPYGPPQGPRSSSPPLGPIIAVAVVVLVILGGVAYWAMSQMDDPPLPIGRSGTPTPAPTSTPAATATRAPGIGINVPGPQGTPTTITLPIPGAGGTPGLPNLPIPGADGSPSLPTITVPTITLPGASGTRPPTAKLTADQAREKVKETLSSCQLLQSQIGLSQVTFEAPTWSVRLPITGATWKVDDETGAVTPDERAAERTRTCRL
jgi:hypothetical protein